MAPDSKSDELRVCPKTGRPIRRTGRYWWVRWVFPLAGLVSLIWFLVRVIPKPSRATYPCQRLAAPIASGFVIWLTGIVGSMLAYRKARRLLGQSRYVIAGVFMAVAVAAMWWSISTTADSGAEAAFTPSDPPNAPIGVGKGVFPGRVVWVHDPESTHWDGAAGRWWEDANVDQSIVDSMVSQSIRTLTGQKDDAAAWDTLFKHFNQGRNLGEVGYQSGEKIVIKINMNQDSRGTWGPSSGMPSPQMIHSLLDQLIHVAGVPGSAITLYDAARYIGDPIYNKVRTDPDPEFRNIKFVVRPGYAQSGRIGATHDPAHPIRFADPSVWGNARAYVPRCVTEADYMINMALLRAHSMFGITACGKNHFGSVHFPGYSSAGGWTPEPLHNFGNRSQPMGTYCCLVDLIGHPHLGGKTLLYMVDALYAARNQGAEVIRFTSFGDDWTSSLFVSQDPVAIDSVALDFIRNEPRATDCTGPGVDNYLHEAALANNPPSGTAYDPDGDGTRLGSLGVHEHWNNVAEKKYSRNLGIGAGIELVMPALTTEDGPVRNLTKGTRYDYIRHAVQDANEGDVIVAAAGVYQESVKFSGKAITLRCEDPNDPNVVAATVIDGGERSVVFTGREDANPVLAGFTITGAAQGIYCENASPVIRNCRIVDNVEAGVKLWQCSDPAASPTFINCIIAGNGGDGIDMSRSGRWQNYATVASCTIVGNCGNGIRSGMPTVANSIVYFNGVNSGAPQIDTASATVDYCNVEGGFAGTGNIDADPGFVLSGYWSDPADPNLPAVPDDPDAVWVHGDCHLGEDSPCVGAGDPALTVELIPTDIDGDPRVVGDRCDIGCDEFAPEAQGDDGTPVCITWIGHASVRIAWEDTVVYVDPRNVPTSPHDATLVLVTHNHSDHYVPGDIAKVSGPATEFIAAASVVQAYGRGQAIAPGQTIELPQVRVTAIPAYNTNKPNHPKANNWVGFVIELGSKRIYVAGDTDLIPEMRDLEDIDVAFLPAGGTYTMNATEAAEATTYFLPKLAIPYHWGQNVGTLADAQLFAQTAACSVKIMAPGETLCSDEWSRDFSVLAHWKLDETQGDVAGDSAGDHDGVLVAGPIWQPSAGRVDGAIQFDGVDDCIRTPFVLNSSEGTFSVFAWAKGGALGQTILSQATGVSWLMADGTAGVLMTELKESGRRARDLVSGVPITDGEWHRIGLVWDGSSRILYVDEVEAARDTQSKLEGLATGLNLGCGPNAEVGTLWSGLIDDVRIYTRAVQP